MPSLSHDVWPEDSGNTWSLGEKAVKYIAFWAEDT